mgnify:CR=1 FL=1
MSTYTRHHRYKELFKPAGSGVWWMFIPTPKGRALRESTGQRDDVAAHRVYLERVRRSVDGTEEAKKDRTLKDALKTRLEWIKSNSESKDPSRKKLAKDTIDFYKKKSGTLLRVLGEDTLLSTIDPEAIRDYVTARTDEGAKGTTIEKELTTLSMAMKLAKKDGVDCSFVRDIKPEDFKTTYKPKERWLTWGEYERFSRWWYANRQAARGGILDFLVSTGATYPSEVSRSRRSEMNLETFLIHIRGTKRETRDRWLTVPSDRQHIFKRAMKFADGPGDSLFRSWGNIRRDILIACAYLSMCKECEQSKNLWWRDGESYAQGTSQAMGTPCRDPKCKECASSPGFEPFCPTDLRRTFAQWLCQAGVPYELAYPLMGHKDDRMLKEIYGKRKASDVGPLIEAVLSKQPKRKHLRAI